MVEKNTYEVFVYYVRRQKSSSECRSFDLWCQIHDKDWTKPRRKNPFSAWNAQYWDFGHWLNLSIVKKSKFENLEYGASWLSISRWTFSGPQKHLKHNEKMSARIQLVFQIFFLSQFNLCCMKKSDFFIFASWAFTKEISMRPITSKSGIFRILFYRYDLWVRCWNFYRQKSYRFHLWD